jgi:hypothetical protein
MLIVTREELQEYNKANPLVDEYTDRVDMEEWVTEFRKKKTTKVITKKATKVIEAKDGE